MDHEFKIIKADPKDAEYFAPLMEYSAPTLFPAILGIRFKTILKNLFCETGNLFSHEFVYIGEINGDKAGMVLGYSWFIKKQVNLHTGWLIIKYMKWEFFKKILFFLKINNVIGKISEGEYYISNIAVYPQYRGKGYGSAFIAFIEKKIRHNGIRRLVLDVEKENYRAVKIYQRLGFVVTKQSSVIVNKHAFEFYRMCKNVEY